MNVKEEAEGAVEVDSAERVIHQNALALFATAKRLHRANLYAHSTHFSILAGEESAKFLLVYCKSHLPQEHYKRRYQHLHKNKVLRAPWFIAGQLSILYTVALVDKTLAPTDSVAETFGKLHRLVALIVGRGEPETVAKAILQCLLEKPDADQQKRFDDHAAQREHDRLSSVYVDVGEDLSVASKPRQIDRKKSRDRLDDAALALAVIEYISDPSLTIFDYVDRLPAREKRLMKTEAARGLRRFRQMIQKSSI